MKTRTILSLLSLLIIILLAITGCRGAEKPNVPNTDQQEDVEEDMDLNLGQEEIREDDTAIDTPDEAPGYEIVERSELIADRIVDLPGIDDATVLITDTTAVVAVEVGDITEGELTNELRSSISNLIKKIDNDVENVSITADPDLFERIDTLEQDLMRGKALPNFQTDIEGIMDRIKQVNR